MTQFSHMTLTPAKLIIVGFALLILAGGLLLSLPVSAKSGQATPFLDALFTATSATCVTGLVIYDTVTHWSLFGQGVILCLIQIGGMGVVTMAVAVAVFTGRKIGLRQRTVMQESISAPKMGGIIRLTKFFLQATLIFEGVGAVLLSLRFIPVFGFPKGLWYGIFHAVSSFCNAGFDLMGEYSGQFSSVTAFVGDPVVSLVIPLLIIIGGLGFFVWDDLRRNRLHVRSYSMQSKVVLTTTAVLVAVPAVLFFAFEFTRPVWADLALGDKILAAFFQAVTPRTAGFNSVDLGLLSSPCIFLMILLMIVGGSPGSTAGGVKTTTVAMMVLCVKSTLKKQHSLECFRRRVDTEVLRNVITLLFLYLSLFLLGAVFLCWMDGVSLTSALFEAASAIGTVGLSLGLTPGLSTASRLALILLMYCGRVGCLTMLCLVLDRQHPSPAQLPLEHIMIG